MKSRFLRQWCLTIGLLIASNSVNLGHSSAAGPTPRHPNILWLIAEDLGPHLGCYGTSGVWTPNLDRLAAEGVRYTKAFTTAPVCSPSRSAFMTGMYQTTIGAHNHRSHRDDGYRLPEGVRLLTDWLRDQGYFTANVRELPDSFGFRGVGKTDWNFTVAGKPFDSDRWSDLKPAQPFFAQINFQETHRPFQAPKRADPAKVDIPPYYPDHPVTRADWAAYLDSASELDRKIGLVLKQLEAEGLLETAVIVFFGDNGQAHVRGKQFCYDSGLAVPLIIRWPKSFPQPKSFQPGTVNERLIAAIDFAPTMLEIAGARPPAKMQGEVFLGEHAAQPREFVFGARDRCDETVFRFRTVRDAQYRYIRNFTPERPFLQGNGYKENQYPVWNLLKELNAKGKLTPPQATLCAPTMPAEELYDLESDPHEINNLVKSPEHAVVRERLRGALEKWIDESGDLGRDLEPAELAARKGVTKSGTNPNSGYTIEGGPPQPARQTPATRPPNIVFILADDLGWTDLGCQGSKYYETPAIDALAARGMRFTSFYNAQNCTPTRAAIMSGQYPPRTGIYTVGELTRGAEDARKMVPPKNNTHLPLDRRTIANQLQAAGYATAIFGKWHIGQDGDYHALRRGFGTGFVTRGRHFDFVTEPKVDYAPGTYLADFLTDQAVQFIELHQREPFFLYLPHFAVHVPHEAKPQLIAKYKAKPPVGGHHDPVYAAMIESVDQSVARVLAKLDELKLADRTVVIFASDNGGVGGYAAAGVNAREFTDNAPLRGGKGMLYEGGVRVPFIVRWPGVIKPGAVCDVPAIHVDLFPTLLEIAGAQRPDHQPLDGVSLVPLWKDPQAKLPREAIYTHFPGYLEGAAPGAWRTTPVGTIRVGDFKLLEFFEDGRLELYNLKDDIGERHDLAAAMPEKVRELHAKLAAWRQELHAAMPVRKPAAVSAVGRN